VGDAPYDEVLAGEVEVDLVVVVDDADTATSDVGAIGGAPSGGAEVEGEDGTAPSVDELFARIRAGSDEPDGGDSPDAPTAVIVSDGDGVVADADKPAGPDDPLIARRDELLSPVTAQLTRHIKRALGDDQNRMLHVLRSAPATQGDALLGPEDAHIETFTSAAYGHLADAFSAGVEFAGGLPGSIVSTEAAEQSSASLARTIVSMLRRSIEEGAHDGGDSSERVGAAFRQWRGERIERLVGDFAVQAFSAGVAAACPPGGLVRWVLTTSDGCSDCDDNALAGGVPAAEGFPTGHPYPPAHSGCRCLVAPAPS
jgi:hypothetical protein